MPPKLLKIRPVPAIPPALQTLHPVLARVYAARGVQSPEDLQHKLKGLASSNQLKGLPKALELLTTALREQKRILIVGDFDADGATSTALAVLALRAIGAQYVDYLVPNRFRFGYGLTPEIVEVALAEKRPELIITVDNGISSREGVALAKAAGVQVLITDHHLTGKDLPDADAILNPNQPDCAFPSKNLCGVGVVFYLLASLVTHLKGLGWFEGRAVPSMADYLDIVALGTVADVVPLDFNNRILVAQGLERIRQGKCRPGIAALLRVGKRELSTLQADDLGFTIAPRLNAAGRLDDMAHGIECLLADSPVVAQQLAEELDALNIERREIESSMQLEALRILDRLDWAPETLPCAVTLYEPGWHQGVIGIVAGRLKDRFHRPCIVFAPADDSGLTIKGSARSIPGIHLRDAIERVATQHPGLITHFGGHAMAAGLTIPADNFFEFSERFREAVAEVATEEQLTASLFTDGELEPANLSLGLAQQLRQGGPWGQAFPEPLFTGEFIRVDHRVLKEKHMKLTLKHPGHGPMLEAIAFNTDMVDWYEPPERLLLAYRLDVNTFRGESRLQMRVEYWEPRPI